MSGAHHPVARGFAPPPPGITLRAATALDAGALGQMITDAVRENAWKPRLHSAAEDIAHVASLIERGWVTVASRGPRPEAFIAREDDYVHALFTDPAARATGLGSALIRQAQQQRARLELWTFEANRAARAFYTRMGFVEIDRTPGDNDEGLPDIRLRWRAQS